MSKITTISATQFLNMPTYRMGYIITNVATLEHLFGRMHYHSDRNFPSDTDKVSVCRGFKVNGQIVCLWSWKNWHYEGEPINRNEKVSFSVWATDPAAISVLQDYLLANFWVEPVEYIRLDYPISERFRDNAYAEFVGNRCYLPKAEYQRLLSEAPQTV